MSALARAGTSRPRRRYFAMFRARPSGLALSSIGLLGAAVIGVQLGESAISEINPIHFQGPLERPRAITPPPEPAPFDPYGRNYVWSRPPDPTLAQCVGDCDPALASRAARLDLEGSAGRDSALPYWRDATPATELRPWAPGEMPNAGRSLERYMRYPVNREQAEAAVAEEAPVRTAASTPAESLRPPPPEPLLIVEE